VAGITLFTNPSLRTWGRSLERLAAGYARALGGVGVRAGREAQREEVQHVGL
jgi:hypothetical protein